MSAALALYRFATGLAEPAGPLLLKRRLQRGKEDAARIGERLGHAGRPRPEGPLVWVHGASVGEGLALLPLIGRLTADRLHVLVTTGTVTSSNVLAGRLPDGVVHQFVPLDLPEAAARFYGHWRPGLVAFAESELWPNLLSEAGRRGIPTVLVNARMSQRSFARWNRYPPAIQALLTGFALILAQSEDDAARLSQLGALRVILTGNVKFDVPAPAADPVTLTALRAAIGDRPVWVAASTHAGEDELCCTVHAQLAAQYPGLLTILVPRQADRGPAIAAAARQQGLAVRLRSRDDLPDDTTDVYVADTMGEVGLFYRISTIAFVGKSLGTGGGGQNPIEAIKLGTAIVHGPAVANFAEVYGLLDAGGGAFPVADAAALARAIAGLLADRERARTLADKAAAVVRANGGATERTLAALQPLLDPLLRDRAP